MRAITDFPTSQSLIDLRSWFGLVNQVSHAFSMTDTMLPFRELLKPSKTFHWDETLHQAFEQSKLSIIHEIKSKSSTKPNPHVYPQTGPNMASVIGCSRSTAPAHPVTSSVANKAGRSLWWEADSHMLLNPDMPQLKEKH